MDENVSSYKFLKLPPDQWKEIYDALLYEAPYIPGAYEKCPTSFNDIPWLNLDLVKQGQEFVQRNFFGIVCAHLGALLYGFSFKRLSTVLLRTGKSHNVSDSISRYLSTFLHFQNWYETSFPHLETKDSEFNEDLINNNNDDLNWNILKATLVDVRKVRALHNHGLKKTLQTPLPPMNVFNPDENVIKALSLDLSYIETEPVPDEILTYEPKILMSQFDMVITQFGLVGLIVLFPISLGIRDTQGLEGFIHIWAIFGRALGIEDRFNIALHPHLQLYKKLYENIGLASLKDIDARIFNLQKTLLEGFQQLSLFGSVKSFLYYGLMCEEALPGFKGQHLGQLLDWKDWIHYGLFKTVLKMYYKWGWTHSLIDWITKIVVSFHSWNKFPSKRKKKFKLTID